MRHHEQKRLAGRTDEGDVFGVSDAFPAFPRAPAGLEPLGRPWDDFLKSIAHMFLAEGPRTGKCGVAVTHGRNRRFRLFRRVPGLPARTGRSRAYR